MTLSLQPAPTLGAAADVAATLERLGVAQSLWRGGGREVVSPVTGEGVAQVHDADAQAVDGAVGRAHEAWLAWRRVPAPRRGELVRLLGEELRAAKTDLARLVTLEAGKVVSEGQGEVQEMIDICDYAVGLSRQLFGLTIATERPDHRMMETWHPLGPIGVITAFNFPVAVWSWNAALALVCGDPVVWKPSEKTPLTALAVQAAFERAAARFGDAPAGLSCVLIGGREVGEALADDPRLPLVSATGSTALGRAIGPRLATRFARALLELGGTNAAIAVPPADRHPTPRVRALPPLAPRSPWRRPTALPSRPPRRAPDLRRRGPHVPLRGPVPRPGPAPARSHSGRRCRGQDRRRRLVERGQLCRETVAPGRRRHIRDSQLSAVCCRCPERPGGRRS